MYVFSYMGGGGGCIYNWDKSHFLPHRFVAISDLYEPTDDGTESQVRHFFQG